jgi:hypothetical protein
MKKSFVVACLLSVFAVSSFAQPTPVATPAELGAKLVAERDAAWFRTHSGSMEANEPMGGHNPMHARHHRHAKQSKHAMHSKHAKRKLEQGGVTNATPANPQ